jgi:hypothetical protein
VSNQLVTVATFDSPFEANLAKNRLEAGGIKAFLANEAMVEMAWQLTSKTVGIKLQVGDGDLEEAQALLAEAPPDYDQVSEQALDTEGDSSPEDWLAASGEGGPEEAEPPLNNREKNAQRAFLGAVVEILFIPWQAYVFWLLLKVFISDEPLRPAVKRKAIAGALINLPIVLLLCMSLRIMLHGWGEP